ncbi:unnamed protein product [Camellia sinensis]
MEDFRSKSYADGRRNQMESYSYDGNRPGPTGFQDLRCYSASYASSSQAQSQSQSQPTQTQIEEVPTEVKFKKVKSTNGSTSSKSWSLNDPELQRKKRVASYKAYSVEGMVKGSFRKSFRWLKDRYNLMVHGWR